MERSFTGKERMEAALQTLKITCQELASDTLFVPFNPMMPDAQEAIRKLMGKVPRIKRPHFCNSMIP